MYKDAHSNIVHNKKKTCIDRLENRSIIEGISNFTILAYGRVGGT